MKPIHQIFTSLSAGCFLALCSLSSYAADNHMAESLKHAELAVKTTDSKVMAEHAANSKSHVLAVEEHLKASVISLDEVAEHSKQGHVDLAKKSAEDAVKHLKAAQ